MSMWTSDEESISLSKFKDNIESLNIDDIQGVTCISKIERENAMKHNFNLKCDVFSNTIYL